MITAERKPMEELIECLRPYHRILLVGCNKCVTVCSAGGRKEVGLLSSALQMAFMKEGKTLEVREITLERQCDPEYIEELVTDIDQAEAVMSMACGCGVQEIARRFKEKMVFPAVNTAFMGASERQGVWAERCQGCGDCVLGKRNLDPARLTAVYARGRGRVRYHRRSGSVRPRDSRRQL